VSAAGVGDNGQVKKTVVVAEQISPAGMALLAEEVEVVDAVGADRPALERLLAGAHGLVVRSATDVDAALVAAAPLLEVIGRAGIGVDNIDLEAATTAGVLVVNAPTANAISAAEHTMALLLAQARSVPEADASLRRGAWERSRFRGVELHGKVLGVVGLGRIGGMVAERAAAFGMEVLAHDPYVAPERARRLGVELVDDLATLLGQCDFLTIHLPLTRDTEGLIDAAALASARDGIRIVNTSRGGIVDEDALAAAVRSGKVAGAALDVFASEPLTASPLFDLPQVVLTPHLGASTVEAQDKAGTDVARAVADALRGELVTTAVNLDLGRDVPDELAAFLPVAERLGGVLVALAQGLPGTLAVRAEGRLADLPVRPLALAAIKGVVARVTDQPVSFVNAPALAEARGMRVVEESAAGIEDYAAVVRLTGTVGDRTLSLAGSVIGRKGAVVVEALDHQIELPISDFMLIVLNEDVPGVIGRVGTYLGEQGINIANMVVGRSPTGDSAMMGLNLDRSMTEPEVEGFRALGGVERAWPVDLS